MILTAPGEKEAHVSDLSHKFVSIQHRDVGVWFYMFQLMTIPSIDALSVEVPQ